MPAIRARVYASISKLAPSTSNIDKKQQGTDTVQDFSLALILRSLFERQADMAIYTQPASDQEREYLIMSNMCLS